MPTLTSKMRKSTENAGKSDYSDVRVWRAQHNATKRMRPQSRIVENAQQVILIDEYAVPAWPRIEPATLTVVTLGVVVTTEIRVADVRDQDRERKPTLFRVHTRLNGG